MSDAELIGHVLGGQSDCFQILVQRYQDSMYRVAFPLVSDSDAAADVVQDAFVRAYAGLAHCRDRTRFRVWLLATVRNRALDYLKEKRRGDLSLSDDAVVRRAERPTAFEDPLERRELRSALYAALADLSQPLREAFVLRHVELLSCEDAAAVLGTSVSAVKMRVHRAREQLQERLGQRFGRPEVPADVTDTPDHSSSI